MKKPFILDEHTPHSQPLIKSMNDEISKKTT